MALGELSKVAVEVLKDRGWLMVPPGEHLMAEDPTGTDYCALCARDLQDLPNECERSVTG